MKRRALTYLAGILLCGGAFSLGMVWAQDTKAPSRQPGAEGDHAKNDSQQVLVFQNVRIFDGIETIPSATVLVRQGKIEAVGKDLQVPEGAERVDGTGKTLLPGLIDCHTHTFLAEHLQQAAALGVTTELEMAGDPDRAAQLRGELASQESLQADLYTAGTPITAPGGHPTQLPSFGQIPTISAPDQAAAFVEDRIAEGSDYLKLIYDDGTVYGLRFPTISRETMRAVVKEAHSRGKLVVAHIATREAARQAVEAGVDGLVHLFIDEPVDSELVRLVLRQKVFVVPTLTVLQSAAGTPSGAPLLEDERITSYLFPNDRSNLLAAFPRQDNSKVDYAVARQAVRQLAEAGVPVLAGSDAPNPGTAHGASLHRELELLVEAGLTPQQALSAATALPAKHFQLSDRGRIVAGSVADLVLVEGDPTNDIAQTRQIVGVWKGGERLDRPAYQQLVERAVQQAAAPAPVDLGDGLVSDFEGKEVSSAFGSGWMVSTDLFVGGNSTARFELAEEGAGESKQSLLVTGTIEERPHPRWAGVTFSPGEALMAPANLSTSKSISFWAKGDGKEYYVMLFFQKRGFIPSAKAFKAGEDWQQHRFELKEFHGCDGSDIYGVFLGSGAEVGDFSLRLDDVRFE